MVGSRLEDVIGTVDHAVDFVGEEGAPSLRDSGSRAVSLEVGGGVALLGGATW